MSNVPNQISLESASRKDSTERRKTKNIFFVCFYAECPSPTVDYTERRKTKRKKIKQSEIKFHQRLPQGKLPRRKE